MITLTIEQAKKFIKSHIDRNDEYEELWEMSKKAKTIETLIAVLQFPVFAGDPLMHRAQYMLDTIQLKKLYGTLDLSHTLFVQKLGLARNAHYGKFFTPSIDRGELVIIDLTADVSRVMDLPYKIVKVGQGVEHWVAYWDASLGEMGFVMALSEKLYGDSKAIKYQPM